MNGWKKLWGVLLAACLLFAVAPCVLATDTTLTVAAGGRYALENGVSYVINATGQTVTNCSITVAAGRTASLTVNGTLTIDDAANGISPISIEPGARLMLFVNGTFTVYGGRAEAESVPLTTQAQPKQGGCAGIHLPAGAALIMAGSGTTRAYGGNADFGGAGAGIGGNGGGAAVQKNEDKSFENGGNGGNAGTLVIQQGTIQAFGGVPGYGQVRVVAESTGIGGKAYPAAGIGGGGGGAGSYGGDARNLAYGAGGGGYNGGGGGGRIARGAGGVNGSAGSAGEGTNANRGGSGYYAKGYGEGIGGGWTATVNGSYHSGQGGAGGAGGSVTVAEGASVTACNGSYNSTVSTASNQTPIYAQLGYDLNNIRGAGITLISGRTAATVTSQLSAVEKTITPPALGLGFGSGAGYTESGNGIYLNETSRSGVPIVEPMGVGELAVYGWEPPAFDGIPALTKYQVDIYADADCKMLVQSVLTEDADVPSEGSPLKVSGLTPGGTYYIKVMAWFGDALGLPSSAAEGRPIRLDASPDSGSFYKTVTFMLNGVNTAGYDLVYAVDDGAWWICPSEGVTLNAGVVLRYGVRKCGKSVVYPYGERTYQEVKQPLTFSSLTLHNSADGTGAALSQGNIAGLSGNVSAKLSGVTSYTSDAGYIVLALYGEGGKMERMTLTPIGGKNGDVVSKPIALPGGMTAAYAVRAFVIESFADMSPVGKIAQIGGGQ